MALCRITGTVQLPDGDNAAGRVIVFHRAPETVTAQSGVSVIPDSVPVRVAQDGTVDFELYTGNYIGIVRLQRQVTQVHFKFPVPESATANFQDIIQAVDPVEPLPSWLQEALDARDAAVDAQLAAEAAAGAANRAPTSWADFQAAPFIDLLDGAVAQFNGVQFVRDRLSVIPDLPAGGGWKPLGPRQPEHYGADGGDDTGPLMAWFNSGERTLLARGFYTFTSRILAGVSVTTEIDVSGAVFFYGGTDVDNSIEISLSSGASLSMPGGTFDGNNSTGCPLKISTLPGSVSKYVRLNDGPSFMNARRKNSTWGISAGVLVVGAFNQVLIDSPSSLGVIMEAGTGVSGSLGVTGIHVRITAATSIGPCHVTVRSPTVRDVYCEDTAYLADQDGVLIWCDRTVLPNCTVDVTDVETLNCLGRSIKMQAAIARIERVHITRKLPRTAAFVGTAEVDIQLGSGYVRDVDVLYDGAVNVPLSVVGLSNTDATTQDTYTPFVDGVRVNALQAVNVSILVRVSPRSVSAGGICSRIDNLDVRGLATFGCFTRMTYNAGNARHIIFGRNWYGSPSDGVIRESLTVGAGTIIVENVVNSTSTVRPILLAGGLGTTTLITSPTTCIGWS